jgi:hypothetical protein
MLERDFLAEFRRATEARWSKRSINPSLYGFQFQRGTRWNPGLSDAQVAEYGRALAVIFPHDFSAFLRAMNGTDMPTLNIYGYCGELERESVGVYSYPRDIEIVKRLMVDLHKERAILTVTMMEQGFDLPPETGLVPIYGHRYLACTSNLESSVVLSIDGGDDAIVYGISLKDYLEREFLLDPLEGSSAE